MDPANAVELLQAAEEAGFESAWTVEHTVVPLGYGSQYPYSPTGRMGPRDDMPIPDPLIWIVLTSPRRPPRIKLATGILILPQHNPVITAKQVATLDGMSGGRVLLGIGVGWLKEEFDAIGAPFAEARGAHGRVHRRDAGALEHGGAHLPRRVLPLRQRLLPCRNRQAAACPSSSAATRRPRRAAPGALGDGFFPARETREDLIELARQTASEHGRDPEALEITISAPSDLEELDHLANLGVSRVLVPVTPFPGMAATVGTPEQALAWKSRIEQYADA